MEKVTMKKYIFISSIFLFLLTSCVKTSTQYGVIAENNRIKMLNISKEMASCDVSLLMGKPYKKEIKSIDNKEYEVWLYLTEDPLLGQTMLIKRNFTPLIFENCKLLGWGRVFYNYLFDIDNARNKVKENKRQQYTNDRDEWPSNKHLEVAPLNAKKEPLTKDLPKTKEDSETQIEDSKKQLEERKDLMDKSSAPCEAKDSDKDYNFWE
jgi:hypothetical protein